MKKKIKNDGIYFLGESANDVTGSQYLVQFGNTKILLECGLHQSCTNDYLDSYKINSEKFKFDPSEIDYLFVCHAHIDHCGLIPRLVAKGFHGKIISTSNTFEIMKSLLLNSCYIVQSEAEILSKRYSRNYEPLYTSEDAKKSFSLVNTYDEYNHIYKLSDEVSFEWLKNSHCVGSTQLRLILSSDSKTKKILYTSDIGSLETKNHYVDNTEIPKGFNDITIMESTYGASKNKKGNRKYDIEHLKTAILTTIERGGFVVMPAFSFVKTQELATLLFEIFGEDESFKTKVVIDSMLSCDICDDYENVLTGEKLNQWKNVMAWKNLSLVREKEDSDMLLLDETPKIIISSSGFCTNGRVVKHIKKHIEDENSMIIFSGFAGDNPSYLSYRIKNAKTNQMIKFAKEKLKNNADCISLASISSHAGYKDLIKYGSSLDTSKLILVHGSIEAKNILRDGMQEAISKNNKTYKVQISNKGMFVKL